jgi:hypothetical protein
MGLLIGIGHKKRQGKDTAANRLIDKHNFVRISWADSVKEAGRIIFGFTDEQLYGSLKETKDFYWGFTPRWALQKLGTEACRDNIDTDIWIKSAWLKINKIWKANPKQGIVIPDVRFPNEADSILAGGGFLWKVDRNIPLDEFSNHPSETALDDYNKWSRIMSNNKDIGSLYGQVDAELKTINSIERAGRKSVFNTRSN